MHCCFASNYQNRAERPCSWTAMDVMILSCKDYNQKVTVSASLFFNKDKFLTWLQRGVKIDEKGMQLYWG